MNPVDLTPEQRQERDALIAKYGASAFDQALELSGLALCMRALTDSSLNDEQREWLYQQGSVHIAKLLESLMTQAHAAKVTECSKRIESITELGVLDEDARLRGL